MTRDRERREANERETDRSGEREIEPERRERVEGTGTEAADLDATAKRVADLGSHRRSDDAVAERVAPSSGGRRDARPTAVGLGDPLEANRSDERVGRRVAPVQESTGDPPRAVADAPPAVERAAATVEDPIRFAERSEGEAGLVVIEGPGVDRYGLPVTERFHPMADRTAEEPYPVGEGSDPEDLAPADDPAFAWTGGSPYTSRRPALVIHRDEGSVPSLSFLQVLLRDAYKEMVGGEPTAERVDFVANEPRFPDVGRSIVTLDCATGEWSRDVRNGRPVIEREGVDLVPELRRVASTLYTGELGYVVVNVPGEWEDPLRHADFFERLVAAVAGEDPDEAVDEGGAGPGGTDAGVSGRGSTPESGGSTPGLDGSTSGLDGSTGGATPGGDDAPGVDRLGSPPVLLAEPTATDPGPFYRTVGRYYGIEPGRDGRPGLLDGADPTGVAQVETLQERVLRADDADRVALTELRRSGEENDEHYLWKAALVEGLIQRCYRQAGPEYDTLREYRRDEVLARDGDVRIHTEWAPEGSEGPVADVYVEAVPAWNAVATFLGGAGAIPGRDLVVEFETGIGEGAHNFRSIRRTLANYGAVADEVSHVAVVVPPRLLFRGVGRARMLVDLVESWDDRTPKVSADLFVPRLGPGEAGGGVPRGLTRVAGDGGAIHRLYGGGGSGGRAPVGTDDATEGDQPAEGSDR